MLQLPCCCRAAFHNMGSMMLIFGLLLPLLMEQAAGSGGSILKLTHRYSGMEGSTQNSGGRGMSQEYWQGLLDHDQLRQGRFLASAVDFPLGGSADPNLYGLYLTEVGLGTPQRNYIVQVDTGSDVLWVNCKPCSGCPTRSGLGIPLSFYDPLGSSTKSYVQCSDPLCYAGKLTNQSACSLDNNCVYIFVFGDGSSTEGYYLKDAFWYEQLNGSSSISNVTTEVIFGCSFNQSGQLTTKDRAVDGILGFGQSKLSVPSQLAAQGRSPHKFAHCLAGGGQEGGILVIGDVVVTNLQYTPLVPNVAHYNVNLLSIAVNSINLSIDPTLFTSGNNSGVIFDSGTTLAYLPQRAYDSFVNAIIESSTAQRISAQQDICFVVTTSISTSFPTVTLNFDGASMQLMPENYLLLRGDLNSKTPVWCIGWLSSGSPTAMKDTMQLTIIGDIVLKDKLVVYDLENSQIGWVDYDCSSEVKVATSSGQTQSVPSTNIKFSDGKKISNAKWNLLWPLSVLIAVVIW